MQHLIGGIGGRVCSLFLKKLFCSGYEGVKRHGCLLWAEVNVLGFLGAGRVWKKKKSGRDC